MYININFGGFYESHHSYIVENAAAYDLDLVDENGDINDPNEDLCNKVDWSEYHLAYAKKWLDMFNSMFDTELQFHHLKSPQYYNYSTDEIVAYVTKKDCLQLFKAIREGDIKYIVFRIIKDRTTSYDGYHAFYKYGDIFEKENLNFLIEFMIDALIERENEDYPMIVEDFYL